MKKYLGKLFIALIVVSFCVFPATGSSTVKAQDAFPPTLDPILSEDGLTLDNGVPPLVMIVDPDQALQGIKSPAEPELVAAIADPSAAAATFSIHYAAAGDKDPWDADCVTFPAAAKAALNKAAAIWSATLQSSVPITISACWSNLGSSSILGYSGGATSYRNFTGAPKSNVWYESSLANALHGSDLDSSKYDDYITYNSNFTWYYGTDGNTPAGQYDLVTVAAHEIAHGLNFSGTASYSGGTGYWGNNTGYPNIYDTFMESPAGTKITSYTSGTTTLGSRLTSNNLWFNGTYAKAANGGSLVKMYAPSSWSQGSSYSHLDYNTFRGTSNSMMVYAVSAASSQHNPGAVTKGIMRDMGWTLVSGTTTVPTPQSPSGTISDTTPTFKWTKVSGATKYQFVLYKGSTQKYSKTVTSSACGSSTCTNTPTTVLAYANDYKWKVRAYVGGAWKSYSAYKTFKITNIPTPQSPSGSITDTTPTFKWTKINGATQYQFSVYKGSTFKYSKTVASGSCGSSSTVCVNTPTTVLSAGSYTWKVRAYVGGAWRSYSSSKSFSVTTSTAFNSTFTSNASGWSAVNGSWSVGSGYYHTSGLSGVNVSSAHSNNYSTLTYEVRIRRNGCSYCANYLYIGGTPSPITSNETLGWYKGFRFQYLNNQSFSIYRHDNGTATALVDWTSYSGISSGWNTLKVTINATNGFYQYFINGTRVAYGTLSTYATGKVGLGFYRDTTSSGDHLYVDWAKLALSAPTSSSIAGAEGLQIDDSWADLNEAGLGSPDIAP